MEGVIVASGAEVELVAGGSVGAGGDGILGHCHDAVWSGVESEIYAI